MRLFQSTVLTIHQLLEVVLVGRWMRAKEEGRCCGYWVGQCFAMDIELFWAIIDLLADLIPGMSMTLRRSLWRYLRTI